MRDNGRITQKEYPLDKDITIVSRTDLHGNIVAANDAFIEASGFEWAEIVGQPHNILRHPDVPPAVFQDFWATLKSGKPWSQIVKNRRKNGDHYWVKANATPIFENGEMIGYMSVRTPVNPSQISEAESIYRAISDGKVKLKNGKAKCIAEDLNPLIQYNQFGITFILSVLLLTSAFTPLIFPAALQIIPEIVFEITDVILVGLIIFTGWFNAKRIQQLSDEITAISEGRFEKEIDSRGNNTLSSVFGRLKSMQIKLGADIEETKTNLASSKRIESALMAATSNIMVADRFRNIIFLNTSVQKMLSDVEDELKKSLPHFDSNNLLNQSIDVFHQHPEHQANLLDKLTDTYNTRMKVGNATIDLIIDPIFDDAGNRIGTVAEWKNMTDKLMVEKNIETMIASAASGDFSQRIDTTELEGFTQKISTSVNTLVDNFSDISQKLNTVLSKMAAGNLTFRLEGDYQSELLSMKTATNNALDNISMTLSQVNAGANEIGSMSQEVAVASEDLSQRTQTQAASLEETAATMEELTATVQHSTDNSEQANKLAHDTAVEASSGIKVMNNALSAMSGISDLSKKIGEITSVIDSIAFQTNLLALNAAVEAARAGEHGRGFAVVAGEVRNLAGKSAEAAKDISGLIDTAIKQIGDGTQLVEETSDAFEKMVSSIKEVEELVSHVASTSKEQSTGIHQINLVVSQLDEITQQNAALVEELSATSGNLSDEAVNQAEFVSRFKLSKVSGASTLSIDFADAKIKHNAWNAKLEQFLIGQDTSLDAESARKPNVCPLGKWIYGDGQKFNNLPSMQQLESLHSEFHSTIGRVIDAKGVDDLELAKQEKDKVYQLSQQVISVIDKLNDELQNSKAQQNSVKKALSNRAPTNQQARAQLAPSPVKSTTSAPAVAKPLPNKPASSNSDEWNEF